MKRLDSRIEQLEAVRSNLASRTMTDLELAVRLEYAISQGGPLAEELLELLAATPQKAEPHKAQETSC